jgi:RHS repeat-associated protein
VTGTRTTISQLQNASTLDPLTGTYSLLVRSSTGKIGTGKLLKVMGGDKIHTTVQYYYSQNTGNGSTSGLNTLTGSLVNLLTNSIGASAGIKSNAASVTSTVTADPNIISFFNSQNGSTNNGRPKAYLNVLFFDEQFKFDNASSYSEQIAVSSVPSQIVIAGGSARQANKNGYCYIYISNETNDMVYFDNLTLTHEKGPILEETHYYPFGLMMAGISSKAALIPANKEKTFQGQQFDDDLGVNLVQFKWRNHDPQIGRFIEIDPLSEEYVYNSTYAFSENKVIAHIELEGLESANFMNSIWRETGITKNTEQELQYNIAEAGKKMAPILAAAGTTLKYIALVAAIATGPVGIVLGIPALGLTIGQDVTLAQDPDNKAAQDMPTSVGGAVGATVDGYVETITGKKSTGTFQSVAEKTETISNGRSLALRYRSNIFN